MVNKELLSYISNAKKKGYSDKVIKEKLIKSEYPEEIVKKAFKKIYFDKILLFSIIGIICICGIIYGIYYQKNYFKKKEAREAYNPIKISSPYEFFSTVSTSNELNETLFDKINITNPSFEKEQEGMLKDWLIVGQAEYVDINCKYGEKCLYVKANEKDFLILNSAPFEVNEGKNYGFSVDIFCKRCENASAYLAIIWLDYKKEEISRNILILNSTKEYVEYNVFSLSPEKAEYGLLGLRIHKELANINSLTELYVDGKNE